jgi:hypothetical protein
MTRKTPFFITASLLVATLALVLPDLELETAAEEPVPGATLRGGAGATTRGTAGAPHAPSAAEAEP